MTQEEILIRLGVDSTSLARGMRSAKDTAADGAKGIADAFNNSGIGSAITAAITNPLKAAGGIALALGATIVRTFEEMQDRVKELKAGAAATNQSMEAFQPVFNAAKATGVEPEAIAKAMAKTAEAMAKVKEGGAGAAEAMSHFAQLGISLEDIKTKDYKMVFSEMFSAMNLAKMSGEQLAAVLGILGEKGEKLMPIFRRGDNNPIDQLASISEEEIAKLDKINRQASKEKAIQNATLQGVVETLTPSNEHPENLTIMAKLMHLFGGGAQIDEAGEQDKSIKGMNLRYVSRRAARLVADQAKAHREAMDRETELGELPEVNRLKAANMALEEKHQQAVLPLVEQAARLRLQMNRLAEEAADSSATEKERQEAKNALLTKQVELDEKSKAIKEATKKTEDEQAKIQTKLYDLRQQGAAALFAPYQPTVHELATSGSWETNHRTGMTRWQQGPYAQVGRQLEWLEADTKDAVRLGNMGRAADNINYIQELRGPLEFAKILPKQTALESIDKNIQDLLDHATGQHGKKLQTETTLTEQS